MKRVRETAVGLGMQRMGWGAAGRARGLRGEQDLTQGSSDCRKALSRPALCLGNGEIALLSGLQEDGTSAHHPSNEMGRLRGELSMG